MSTHGGDSFPGPNTLFGRVHRVSRSLVPSSLRSGLSSLRSGLSSPTYRFITKTCVRPIVELANVLVDGCYRFHIEKMEKIQKKAVKTIDRFAYKGSKYEDLLLLYRLVVK